ncbi:MAG: right-handed parallel beta-helix repeat-containing protein, partial [Candidatus Saccharimonas sp.]
MKREVEAMSAEQITTTFSRRQFLLTTAVVGAAALINATEAGATAAVVDLVTTYGLKVGSDITAALNHAIVSNPGKVLILSGSGTYLLNDTGVRLNQPGTVLKLGSTTLKLITSTLGAYNLITVSAPNCAIFGGTIIGDVRTHKGTTGEWGHGVRITAGATSARVSGTKVNLCWGDGIYLNAPKTKGILIDGVRCDRNRRQGISVIACGSARLVDCFCTNTGMVKYTAPGNGIDLEPNAGAGDILGLTIARCTVSGNRGGGLLLVAVAGTANVADISDCTVTGNSRYGIRSCRIGAGTTSWRISSSLVSKNKGDGVQLSAPATLSNVRSTGNSNYGFSFLSGSNGSVATSCTADHNSAGSR